MKRRKFYKTLGIAGLGATTLPISCADTSKKESDTSVPDENRYDVPEDVSKRMYDKAIEITKAKIRGGDSEKYFKKPFIDAAFSQNIFLWDTCFMACYAKYHIDELPVYQALDNFYEQMEDDGFICREYRFDGRPLWSKDHPVSVNPPLLAFAETEMYAVSNDKARLEEVYPKLKKNFEFLVSRYQGDDKLFWGDTLGMGMDNLRRYPKDWKPTEGSGLTHHELGEIREKKYGNVTEESIDFFVKEYVNTLQGIWNDEGRIVDFTSQMAAYALQLKQIAKEIGSDNDISNYELFHKEVKAALNTKCWSEEDAFYYDLGFDKPIKRKHIGMYWALLGDLVPEDRLQGFIAHLTNPEEFFRKMPLCSLSADDPDYKGWGDYWLGGVWPPTSYMVIKGLSNVGEHELAKHLAKITYHGVAQVFEATDTFWENYAPDLIAYGMPSKKDFCGWTALVPIALYKEYIV
ncbi:MGH1-like glycoside hydrolase domain-containing protein [Flagellimonas lutimaris]|uniref:MGH1-like glycoside hydrolase domain-containing protein n=1 Tax=Flagellimonas lutimaris TaxID=475082 RepID=UPI003F5CEA83